MAKRKAEDEVWDNDDDPEIEEENPMVPIGDPKQPDLPGVIGGRTRYLPGDRWTPICRQPSGRKCPSMPHRGNPEFIKRT